MHNRPLANSKSHVSEHGEQEVDARPVGRHHACNRKRGGEMTRAAHAIGMAIALAHFAPSTAMAQRSFAAPEASQSPDGYGPDLIPQNEASRLKLLSTLAFNATIYALPAYLQYEQLYRQAVNRQSSDYTGFNRFSHDRNLAGPGYVEFKVPNSDTLYSNAWLNLSSGPVEVTIPPTSLSYYTLNFFDMFGTPTNLSTRTVGSKGGRFLIVPPEWQGEAPSGVTLYHARTRHMWILMRVFAQTDREVAAARHFQDNVSIVPKAGAAPALATTLTPPAPASGAAGLLRVLDFILRTDGPLPGEQALVATFRPLDVLNDQPFDFASLDPASRGAVEQGYRDAMTLIDTSKTQLGKPTGTGWSRVDKGKYGYNYVRRAAINAAGLGANVPEENSSFTTFIDGSKAKLDAATGDYVLTLDPPPQVNAFWSATLYDAKTFELYPNALKRYLINDRTRGLKTGPKGSVTIRIQHAPTKDANWLPAPDGPFFVVIRSYTPRPEMLDGRWLPMPISRVGPATASSQGRAAP